MGAGLLVGMGAVIMALLLWRCRLGREKRVGVNWKWGQEAAITV